MCDEDGDHNGSGDMTLEKTIIQALKFLIVFKEA
jgi:hypothetical protein